MVRLRSYPLLVLCLFASLTALGATHVWTGASDDHFSNASNWLGGSPAGDAAASISFPATSRTTATNDLTGLTVQSIAFSTSGFTISGNAITLAGNGTVIDTSRGTNTIACNLVLAGDVAVSVAGDIYDLNGLVLSGVISGSGGITLRGGGHLVYTGSQPNSYSGLTRVHYGELQLKKAANVTAIAGDLEIANDGFNYEYGYLSIFNDEQIANSSHVTVGYAAKLGCNATETFGPVTLTRTSQLQTSAQWSGNITLTGTVILAGDIEITGIAQDDVRTYGTFLLQGTRTINATANYGLWSSSGLGQTTAGSGIILNAAAYSDGTFSDVLELQQATYDGPTILNGGSVRIDAPKSAVDLRNGRYSGHCKSLTATGGVLYLHGYFGGVTSDGDVKLSPSVTLGYDLGTALKMNGALDLGGATLRIDGLSGFSYGAVYKVVDNTSTKPVIGTLANLPEGALLDNRFRVSYAGGDGNDVTITDVGLVPPNVSLAVSTQYPQIGIPADFTATVSASQQTPTGTVTFSAGTTVLGTAPVNNGVAKLTAGASLPRGHYLVRAAYSGDSRVAPATSSAVDVYVVALKPTLTSIDPPAIPAGVKSTLTLHGTNFIDGSFVYVSSFGRAATFVSPTELRLDHTPPISDTNYQLEVWVSQPDPFGAQESARLKLNVIGGPTPPPPPSPFTFGSNLTTTLTGVTPGAMTLWFAVARSGSFLYNIDNIVNDTDHDGTVALPFPFKVNLLPQFGVWLVADLNAHTIVSDNPSRTALDASPFPSKAFLRDSDGNYTHVQFPASGSAPSMFGWARPGVGAWMTLMADGAAVDEDSGPNGRVTFETPSMLRTIGTTATPPTDGIRPGDMFLAIDGFGQAWWGDAVDLHLSESDGPGKLGFVIASTNAAENSGSAKILVERTEGTDGTVTVHYATADDTAIAGKHYSAQAGQLTFGPGEIFRTITIPLLDDQSYGGGGQFNVNLSDPAGASIGLATHTIKVADDEHPPLLSLQLPSASVPEGDAGRVDVPITVKLTGATSVPATVSWVFSEAQTGASRTGELQFAPGETQKTFTVSYTANTLPEPNRTITLHLFNPKNATASNDATNLTIVDDDFAGVSVADVSVNESAGKVVVPLQLSRSSQKTVTVTYETRNGTALAGADYVVTTGTITVGQSSSITIPIVNDAFHESLEAFEIVLTSVNGGKLERATAAVIVIDDDTGAPPPPATPRRRSAPH
jgi:Calx-beta domain/Bacterial Ig-like domain (group 3)/IPT/TIG domain